MTAIEREEDSTTVGQDAGELLGATRNGDVIDGRTDARHEFELRLPLPSSGSTAVTHVVALRGAEASFERALRDRLGRDLVLASALHGPMGIVSLGELADLLNSVDDATVLSIDRV